MFSSPEREISTEFSDTKLDPETIEKVAQLFKLLCDPTRLRIIQSLCAGERTVGAVVEEVGASQANVSKHLALLAAHQTVERRRDGLNVFYSVREPLLLELCRTVKASLKRNG
jgi:DNA-binding transcriptional ArsR family regulator